MESILTSIKKLLGIAENYTQFDTDIIMHINSVFTILTQIGVGPATGFAITGVREVWSDFIPNNLLLLSVKTYTYLRVRLLFDPPTSSAVMEAINKSISELEWRLMVSVENQPAEAVGAAGIAIRDDGDYFAVDTVEAALQEIGAEIDGASTLLGEGVEE